MISPNAFCRFEITAEPEAVRKNSHPKNGQNEEFKQVRGKLDCVPCLIQKFGDTTQRVPAPVTCDLVFLRPERLKSGNGDVHSAAARLEYVQRAQERRVILDVLDHIEEPDRGKSARKKSGVFGCAADNLADTSPPGIAGALETRLNENNVNACLLNGLGNVAVSTADIEERSGRRELAQHFEDAVVPVLGPKRGFFHFKAVLMAGIGKRDR